jgi:hypothetical protein
MEAVLVKRVSNRELAAGVFRAWGVFWGFYAALSLVRIGGVLVKDPYASQPGMRGLAVRGEAINLACEILIFVLLMRGADRLARVVFPSGAELGLGIGAAELASILFSAVGLYFAIAGARGCVEGLYRLVAAWRQQNAYSSMGSMVADPARLAASLAEMILGAVVFFRGSGRGSGRGPISAVRSAYDRTLGLHDAPPAD